jgi:hypothetical protein
MIQQLPADRKTHSARMSPGRSSLVQFLGCAWFLSAILLGGLSPQVQAQKRSAAGEQKLPAAEKIVENYLKACGGRRKVTAIRDATLEYTIQLNNQPVGMAKIRSKAPGFLRSEMLFGNGTIITAANGSSAWAQGLDGAQRTLTGVEAGAVKLQALLDAGHLVDYKKANIAARVISLGGNPAAEPEYLIEFSTRGGARIVYSFSRKSGLITRIEDEARKLSMHFADYHAENGLSQAHQITIDLQGSGQLTLLLQHVDYNTGLTPAIFDPSGAASFDVTSLLRAVARNQDQIEQRFTEYSFLEKETDREINGKGEVTKETVKVHEVFPIAHREPIMKLISENGVPLSPDRAVKEEKRVQEEFIKAERDAPRNEEKEQKRKAESQRKAAAKGKDADDSEVAISQFLKVCEFVSPRHERFRDRDAVVFDFRARPGFHASNRQEDLISKLVGVVWIDPADNQVMRLEARLAEGFKMAGGVLLSLRPGAAFVMEQTRMVEGVWLPRLAQVNLSVKVLLFGGGDMNKTIEWSDYKHFKGDVGDYKLNAPKQAEPEKKP